jgi:putative ABC transport system permease protein
MLWKRLAYLLPWRRRAAERDMREELRSVASMAGPGELGNLTIAAEDARREWGWRRLDEAGRDLRYALRSLRKTPGFTATAILSLALGIGANTALFTMINAVTWRMLPVADPEHLLVLSPRQGTFVGQGFTYPQYSLIRDSNSVLDMAAYSPVRLNVTIDGHAEPTAEGQMVSGQYFSLLGVRPAAGRLLGPDDDRVPFGHPVAMISYAYWNVRFALNPAVVGRELTLSGRPFTIVGVTPREFFGVEVGAAPQIFVPVMMQPVVVPTSENLLDRPILNAPWLRPVVRLKEGVSVAQAHAALARLAESPETDWRPTDKFGGGRINQALELTSAATGLSELRSQYSQPLRVLLGIVGLVLLIACANTGNLMLARAAARRSEFALRLALGAGRPRLIRQVLVEGLAIAVCAGAFGVALAYWATQVLVTYVSAGRSTLVLDLAPDIRVLAFTAGVSALTGIAFAIAPALRASRIDVTSAGKQDLGSRGTTGRLQPGRPLVVAQVALSLVLLVAAGLFIRSLQNLNGRQSDVDRESVLVIRVEPRGSDQRGIPGTIDRLDVLYQDLLSRVEAIPGVRSATLARSSPLSPVEFNDRIRPLTGNEQNVPTMMTYPGYPETMGLSVVSGRDFNESDLAPTSPLVLLANEAFVREVLGGKTPLGVAHGAMLAEPGRPPQFVPLNIVGVVEDSPYPNLRDTAGPVLYQTFRQTRTGRGQMVLHVRVAGETGAVAVRVREAVQRVDRDVPTFELHTLADEVDATLVRERLVATLAGFFGIVALVLVSVGLYGLVSFSVSRRTAEIGVRVALGARRFDVAWMIARQTLSLLVIGLIVGVPVAWALARVASQQISTLLFGLSPSDPLTIAASIGVLAIVAMGAGWLPARRAARIDPVSALRTE